MPTTYTNGLKLPDLGSIDWYNSYKNNIDILDPIVGTVNGVATTYAPISHNHDASEITSGTIDIARLPPAALERLTTVADQTARYALTTSTVQLGDTVKQLDTGIMYLVVDTTKLNSADGYVEYSAGTASKAIADEDGTSIKSGYVNVAGNQTITGQKTWSGNQTYNGMMVLQASSDVVEQFRQKLPKDVSTSTDALARFSTLVDSAGHNVVVTTEGHWETYVSKSVSLKYKNDSTKAGTVDFRLGSNGKGILYPQSPFECSLGNATNQWSSVYAQTYYYNGTAWGLDKANTWTGNNTFTASTIALKNTVLEQGVAPSSANSNNLAFVDKNGNTLCYLRNRVNTDGETYIHLYAQNKFTNGALDPNGTLVVAQFYVGITKNGTPYVVPRADTYPDINNAFNLGTSTNKWKTLNGINPGALSLPDLDNSIDITSTFNASIDKTQNTNSYTADFTGWLYVIWWTQNLTPPFFIYFFCTNSATESNFIHSIWGQTFSMPSNAYWVLTVIPVTAGKTYWFETSWTRASTDTKNLTYKVYKLPSLGNV